MKNPFQRSGPVPGPAGEMTLVDHLAELRTRIIRSVAAVLVGAIGVYAFNERIFDFLSEPYCDIADVDGCAFLVTSPLEPFSVTLTLSGYGGLILALPVVFYQMGRFVMPGLYDHEKKAMIPFLVVAVLLLFAGVTLGYFFLPRALDVLTNEFGSERFETFFSPDEYLKFFIKMVLAFGLAFELPLILVFLQKVGLIQTETLRKNRRIAAVLVVILGAVITPTGDPLTLLALSLPMYIFYEIAMVIGSRFSSPELETV